MSCQHQDKKKGLDLTAAIRILENTGRGDPRLPEDDPDTQTQKIIDALCAVSIHDGLTGLMNATFFYAILAREIERSIRTGRNCGLMVIDVDHFKKINDTFGHGVGDNVLRAVAAHIKHNLRGMDTAARIGGEEFAIILPECEPADAIHAAMRIHSGLNPLALSAGEQTLQLTTSGGLVWTSPAVRITSLSLVAEADREMYRAKQSGRGRLCYKNLDSTMVSRRERTALLNLQAEENKHDR
ncbi:MAG TPA: GGDEF domain-containing protein [Acidobacteriota bacterium]|nr:GGDEF domain-containing protein [Acidobacteriota bacterium]